MDQEEERVKVLMRLGRENVIKYGTYDMDKSRSIIQDHPFYKQPEEEDTQQETMDEEMQMLYDEQEYNEPASNEPVSEEDAQLLAAQIMQNNFRTGMSQADVDSLLGGLI